MSSVPGAALVVPRVAHAGGVGQQVDVLALVLLVDLGPGLEDGVDEELEELRDPDELDGRRVGGGPAGLRGDTIAFLPFFGRLFGPLFESSY